MCNTEDINIDDIPEVVYDSAHAKRGALNPLSPSKDRITIRLDKDILAWFKGRVHEQGGGNYQTLINDALRRATTENPKRDTKELPPMQPTYRPVRTGGPGFSIFVVCFLLAAALTLGAFMYWKRNMNAKATPPAKQGSPFSSTSEGMNVESTIPRVSFSVKNVC